MDPVGLNSMSPKGVKGTEKDVDGNHTHHGACEPGTIVTVNGTVPYGGPTFHAVIPSTPTEHVCNVACTGVSTK